MKKNILIFLGFILLSSCTSTKKLSYLNNLPESSGERYFAMDIPTYKIQKGDILYITLKALTPDGLITDYLSSNRSNISTSGQNGTEQFLFGYDVNPDGDVTIPVIGTIHVEGLALEEVRKLIKENSDKNFKNATVECKLLSFKFTVIGEVRSPATYINYNNYLTVLEAIGRAGGISDFGKRSHVLVVRPTEKGTKTYHVNLQDKSILSSEAYYLMPNDVVIVEPQGNKIFNMNLPTISFILTSITSTVSMLILILSFTK
jgi:polysaccharide export outer membrane protein